MQSESKRPVYLNLVQIRLPIAGFMSILHRAAGALLFVAIPFSIYLLDLALSGEQGFHEVRAMLSGILPSLLIYLMVWGLVHHLFAGIRYLLLDIEIGIDRPGYQLTAWIVTLAAPVISLFLCWGLL